MALSKVTVKLHVTRKSTVIHNIAYSVICYAQTYEVVFYPIVVEMLTDKRSTKNIVIASISR